VSTVGRNLGRLLGERGMTGNELGQQLGHKTGSYVSAIVSGRKHPGPGMIEKIAAALDVSPAKLTQAPGPAPKPGKYQATAADLLQNHP